MTKKLKLLIWGDSPTATTGFGRVNREIISGISKKFDLDIHVLGVNYEGDPHEFPFKIYPTMRFLDNINSDSEPFGYEFLEQMIIKETPDIVFLHNDPWNIEIVSKNVNKLNEFLKQKMNKQFVTIAYLAIDGEVYKNWMLSVKDFDFLATYSDWARGLCIAQCPEIKSKLKTIHIGVDKSKYFSLKEDKFKLKRLTFGLNEDRTVFTIISRNTQRKQLGLALEALKMLKDRGHRPFLYIHSNPIQLGYNLLRLAEKLNLKINEDYFILNKEFFEHRGFDDKILNQIYNASDCLLSTSIGEGFGMSPFEAAAANTLLLLPEIPPYTDFWKNKAVFYKTAGKIFFPYDLERLRPAIDLNDMVDKMELIIKSKPDKWDKLKQEAARYVAKFDWPIILEDWYKLFKQAIEKVNQINQNL